MMTIEDTLTNVRVNMRYADETDPDKTNSYTYRNIALSAANDKIIDFADCIKSLLYNPALAVETFKIETSELYSA